MAAKTAKKTGGSRKMSPYNHYVKVQLAKLKEADEKAGVKGDHKLRFKKVAEMWKTAPENPKRTT